MSSSRYTTKRMTFQEVKNEEEFRYFLTHDFNFNNESIIYGFNDLSSMNLISAHYEDAFTSNNLDSPINRPSTYRSLEDFSNHSGYSELVFKSDKIKSNFIVCFDKVDDYDLETARRLNIDIVCINTKKYAKDKESKSSDIRNKKYINY